MEALVPISMFMCIAAVAILRPISTRLGGLLEAMTRERAVNNVADQNAARTALMLEQVSRRLDLIDERLDFTERLVSTAETRPAIRRFRDEQDLLRS